MDKKNDARYKATEEKIHTVFYDLLSRKDFSDIRTTDLIRRAGINKSTFYAHYDDKYDLLDRSENTLLDNFFALTEAAAPQEAIEHADSPQLNQHYLHIAEYILEHKREFQLLLNERSESRIISKLAERIKKVWLTNDLGQPDLSLNTYLIAATASMISGLIQEWIRRDFKESAEEFADIVHQLADGLHRQMMQQNPNKGAPEAL
ncbi:MAG: TetR/AcrR family transcriptional regulator [Eubacterium sp.]